MDETYIRVHGRWTYLYRAVDQRGLTVDFLLSERRDIAAAKRFFSRAIERHGTPKSITLDGYPATQTAVAELKNGGVLRQETKIKNFRHAAVTISGIELAQKIKKGQFDTSRVAMAPECR